MLKCPYGTADKVEINAICRKRSLVAYTITRINERVRKAGLEVTLYLISKTPLADFRQTD